jgi:hypothetical protein
VTYFRHVSADYFGAQTVLKLFTELFVFINAYLEHVFVERRLIFNTGNRTDSILHLFYRISFSDVLDLFLDTRILVTGLDFAGVSERIFSVGDNFPAKGLLLVAVKGGVEH